MKKFLVILLLTCFASVAIAGDWPERQNILGAAGGGGTAVPASTVANSTLAGDGAAGWAERTYFKILSGSVSIGTATSDGVINIVPTDAQVTNAGLDIQAPDDYGSHTSIVRIGDSADNTLVVFHGDGSIEADNSIVTSTSMQAFISISTPEFDNSSNHWSLMDASGLDLGSDRGVAWSSTTIQSNPKDIGLARDSAGLLEVTDGSTGTGSIKFDTASVGTSTTDGVIHIETPDAAVTNAGLDIQATSDYIHSATLLRVGDASDPNVLTVDEAGRLTILDIFSTSDAWEILSGAGFLLGSDKQLKWSATTSVISGAKDTGLTRDSAAVIRVTDGTLLGTGSIKFDTASVGTSTTDGVINIVPTAAQITNAGIDIQAPDVYGGGQNLIRIGSPWNAGILKLDGNGTLTTVGSIGTTAFYSTSNDFFLDGSGVALASDIPFLWSSTTSYSGAKDIGLERDSAGLLEVTDGSTGTGSIKFDTASIGTSTTDGVINIVPLEAAVTNAGLDIQAPDGYATRIVFRVGCTTNNNLFKIQGNGVANFSGSVGSQTFYSTTSDWLIDATGIDFASNNTLFWSSTTSYSGAKDVGIERLAAGVLLVDDGSTGGRGQIDANLYTIAGITASTTQTQGNGPLTATVNEVSTVANVGDTVTMPTASVGREYIRFLTMEPQR